MNAQRQCLSSITIIDHAATAEAVCTLPDGHDEPHQSLSYGWPRLDQRTGHLIPEATG
jgi:hypothetical protein